VVGGECIDVAKGGIGRRTVRKAGLAVYHRSAKPVRFVQ
jgi:hypothetical protein